MKLALATLWVLWVGGVAAADPNTTTSGHRFGSDRQPHERLPVGQPAEAAEVPRTLWLNRCAGGCTLTHSSRDDARAHESTIPEGDLPSYTISEFDQGDAAWNALVTCVKEVYSPYDVTVTDVKPPTDTYNEAIVAGRPSEIGRSGIGGIAPAGCDPYNNVISFSFAKIYGSDMIELCATVAQETGHAYAMDHEYEYLDGRSACTDPMTYREDCGGQQFFRNETAYCGEFARRPMCYCGQTTQNSHVHLTSVLGKGTPITPPPTLTYVSPAADTMVTASTKILVTAGAQRGVKRVELYINGYKWSEVPGAAWGTNGQPATSYQLPIPAEVPDSILDLKIVAKDDIDIATESAIVTVTKGAACSNADTCLDGQKCESGRCFWEPPTGELGDVCTYEQFCKTGICTGTATEKYCTVACVPGSTSSCDVGFDCLETGPGMAVCFPTQDDPGCCSSGNGAVVQTFALGFGLLLVLRRRRR